MPKMGIRKKFILEYLKKIRKMENRKSEGRKIRNSENWNFGNSKNWKI